MVSSLDTDRPGSRPEHGECAAASSSALRRSGLPARAALIYASFVAVLVLWPCFGVEAADGAAPVSARLAARPEGIAIGESGTVRVELRIAEGWHINGDRPRQDFLIPTHLEFEAPAGLDAGEVRYPAPVLRKLPFAGGEELALFEGKVVFEAALTASSDYGPAAEVVAVVGYQACTDTLCKPPAEFRLPFRLVRPPADAGASVDPETRRSIEWVPFGLESYQAARGSGEPFVLEFTADWCAPCREMAARTFTDPAVLDAAGGARFLSVDLTHKNTETWSYRKGFDAPGAPTLIFFAPGGREHTRRLGFVGPEDFARLIEDSRAAGAAPPERATGDSSSNSPS